jgi:hypothetical protein
MAERSSNKRQGGGVLASTIAAVNQVKAMKGPSEAEEAEAMERREPPAMPEAGKPRKLSFVRDEGYDRLLRARDFSKFGPNARCHVPIFWDRSPSVGPFVSDLFDALRAVADTLGKSALGRNLIDTTVVSFAEDARVESFDCGSVTVTNDYRPGNDTLLLPALRKADAVVTQHAEHLRGLGVGTRPSMFLLYGDYRFRGDWDEQAVLDFRAAMRSRGMVVVSAMFGHARKEVAEKLSTLPAVDCKQVPLDTLLEALVNTLQVSLGRPGDLEEMLRGAIESLTRSN